jgi:hypothetical protein
LREVLRGRSIHPADNDVITFVGLEGDSFDWAELLLSELFDLLGVNDLRGLSRIDATSLDRNNEMASVLDEHASVEAKDTGLIGLGDISEDNVNHGHNHSVLLGVTSVLNDGDHISALLGHIDEVTTTTLGELDSINCTFLFNIINFNNFKK